MCARALEVKYKFDYCKKRLRTAITELSFSSHLSLSLSLKNQKKDARVNPLPSGGYVSCNKRVPCSHTLLPRRDSGKLRCRHDYRTPARTELFFFTVRHYFRARE